MPVNLNAPLSWKSAAGDDKAMLENLQPNILKAHTREFLSMFFVRFADQAKGRAFLRALSVPSAKFLKSALDHLGEVAAFKASGTPGTPYFGVGLTKPGYDLIGVPVAKQPGDAAFRAGMPSHAGALGDPAAGSWEAGLSGAHAVVLVGDQLAPPQAAAVLKLKTLLAAHPGVTVLVRQNGHGQHNDNEEGIEHFGYVDGRSQPIFLVEDLAAEKLGKDGITTWDAAFPIGRAIVADPASPTPAKHFGSYFVFRKLEQNVKLFKTEEQKLAARLSLTGDAAERAGAIIVGRFEDGTPLAVQYAEGSCHPVPNDFDYSSDPEGGKCPHLGHIRKMNPRGSGGFEPPATERLHIMARRGQTYGVCTDGLNDGKIVNKPTKDVGLLFMAFNADIGEQFEFVQKNWANFGGFPKVPAGVGTPGPDLIIGNGARPDIECPVQWGSAIGVPPRKTTRAPKAAVTMKGGDYFFMPSIAFLRSL